MKLKLLFTLTVLTTATLFAQNDPDISMQKREHFEKQIYDTLIPRSVRLSEAPSHGKPVILYDANSTGSAAYRQFAREFLARRNGTVLA